MKPSVQYRLMQAGEEQEVCALVTRVFTEFIAHQYSEEGVQEFLRYIKPRYLSKRRRLDDFIILAIDRKTIVGMIELVARKGHVSLFYTDRHFQGIGIGRTLLDKGIEICRKINPAITDITVNSSPNAVSIYEKLGFSVMEPEKEKNGIRFVPMKLKL